MNLKNLTKPLMPLFLAGALTSCDRTQDLETITQENSSKIEYTPYTQEEKQEISNRIYEKKVESPKKYSEKDFEETVKIVYAEAANQSSENRKLVARVILNRAESPDYPSTPYEVIHQRNAFSCTFDGSKLWKQANGDEKISDYEERVLNKINEEVNFIYNGNKIGVPRESEIIAYHDISIQKPRDNYWNSLEEVFENERLIFYAPKN